MGTKKVRRKRQRSLFSMTADSELSMLDSGRMYKDNNHSPMYWHDYRRVIEQKDGEPPSLELLAEMIKEEVRQASGLRQALDRVDVEADNMSGRVGGESATTMVEEESEESSKDRKQVQFYVPDNIRFRWLGIFDTPATDDNEEEEEDTESEMEAPQRPPAVTDFVVVAPTATSSIEAVYGGSRSDTRESSIKNDSILLDEETQTRLAHLLLASEQQPDKPKSSPAVSHKYATVTGRREHQKPMVPASLPPPPRSPKSPSPELIRSGSESVKSAKGTSAVQQIRRSSLDDSSLGSRKGLAATNRLSRRATTTTAPPRTQPVEPANGLIGGTKDFFKHRRLRSHQVTAIPTTAVGTADEAKSRKSKDSDSAKSLPPENPHLRRLNRPEKRTRRSSFRTTLSSLLGGSK